MIKAILYKAREREDGKQPIYIRVSRAGKASYKSLKTYINPKLWDEDMCKVKKKHPNHAELNRRIAKLITSLEQAEARLLADDESISSKEVIVASGRTELEDIFKFCSHYIKKFDNKRQMVTHERFVMHMNKLYEFMKTQGLPEPKLYFDKINVTFLKRYHHFLLKTKKNKKNTIWATMKNIRALFNAAINEDVIKQDVYPFRKFKLETEETQQQILTEEQIIALATTALTPGTLNYHARNTWMLQFYLGGLRISDVLSLQWEELNESLTTLKHVARKTGKLIHIEVPANAQAILRHYKETNHDSKYVLPHMKDVKVEDLPKAISSATVRTNKALARVAKKAGIPVFTSHSARSSFARHALDGGKNIFRIKEMLQHSSLATTQKYLGQLSSDDLSKSIGEVSSFIPKNNV